MSRVSSVIVASALALLALPSSAALAQQPTPWSFALVPNGCHTDQTDPSIAAFRAALAGLDPTARDDPTVVWDAIGSWFDVERGVLVAADIRLQDDEGTYVNSHVVITGETLMAFMVDELSMLQELTCAGFGCRSEGGHSYSALEFYPADDDRVVVAGVFLGSAMVTNEREVEVSASETNWRREVRRFYGTDVSDLLAQARILRAYGRIGLTRSLLEQALDAAPTPNVRERLAAVLWDLGEDEAFLSVASPLACDRSREALEALAALETLVDPPGDEDLDTELIALFTEVRSGPPSDINDLPAYLARFRRVRGHVRSLIDESADLIVIGCPDEVWETVDLTPALLARCNVETLRRRSAAERLIEAGVEIHTWGSERLPGSYLAVAGFNPLDESDVIVASPSNPTHVAVIIRQLNQDDIENLDEVIGYALGEPTAASP